MFKNILGRVGNRRDQTRVEDVRKLKERVLGHMTAIRVMGGGCRVNSGSHVGMSSLWHCGPHVSSALGGSSRCCPRVEAEVRVGNSTELVP